jgi:hypothetical protein
LLNAQEILKIIREDLYEKPGRINISNLRGNVDIDNNLYRLTINDNNTAEWERPKLLIYINISAENRVLINELIGYDE